MMQPIDIILSLMDPQVNHSAIIEQAWDEEVEHFWIGLSLGTSPDYQFNLERVPAIPSEDDEPGTLTFEEFYDLALRIANEDITGAMAAKAVEEAAMRAEAREWNLWYRRILLKSLPRHLPMALIREELIRLTTE
jgi:hypothetical protein